MFFASRSLNDLGTVKIVHLFEKKFNTLVLASLSLNP